MPNFKLIDGKCSCPISEGFGLQNKTTCVLCPAECPFCSAGSTCQGLCRTNFEGPECRCPEEKGFILDVSNNPNTCECNKCIFDDGECRECPEPFVPSPDPEDFFLNAALAMYIVEKTSESQNIALYRVYFSEEAIVFLSPLGPDTISGQITVSLDGYQNPSDYTYTVKTSDKGEIELTLNFNTDIQSTDLTIAFQDYTLVVSENGKKLQNG